LTLSGDGIGVIQLELKATFNEGNEILKLNPVLDDLHATVLAEITYSLAHSLRS